MWDIYLNLDTIQYWYCINIPRDSVSYSRTRKQVGRGPGTPKLRRECASMSIPFLPLGGYYCNFSFSLSSLVLVVIHITLRTPSTEVKIRLATIV